MTSMALPSIYVRVGTWWCTFSPAVVVWERDFADDIASLPHNQMNAQSLLITVEQEALSNGIKINCKNTEYVLVGDFRLTLG